MAGIEPTPPVLKTDILPLNYNLWGDPDSNQELKGMSLTSYQLLPPPHKLKIQLLMFQRQESNPRFWSQNPTSYQLNDALDVQGLEP